MRRFTSVPAAPSINTYKDNGRLPFLVASLTTTSRQPTSPQSFFPAARCTTLLQQPALNHASRASRCTVTPTTNQNITHSFLVRSCALLPSIQTPEPSHTSLPFVCIHNPHLTPVCPSLSVAQPQLSTVTYKGRRQQSPFTCTLLFPTIKLGSAGQHRAP